MKIQSEEAKNLDQFLSDMSEVFEIPKRTLERMVFQFDEEPEIIRNDHYPREAKTSKRVTSTRT